MRHSLTVGLAMVIFAQGAWGIEQAGLPERPTPGREALAAPPGARTLAKANEPAPGAPNKHEEEILTPPAAENAANTPPYLKLLFPTTSPSSLLTASDLIPVYWEDADPDSAAMIRFFYHDDAGTTYPLASGVQEDDPANHLDWDMRALPEGRYKDFLGEIDDGVNPVQRGRAQDAVIEIRRGAQYQYGAALEAPDFAWFTVPGAECEIFTSDSLQGASSILLGQGQTNPSKRLLTVVNGPARVNFAYKGYIWFILDGEKMGYSTGGWSSSSFCLGPGLHILEWQGYEASWWDGFDLLDNFRFEPFTPSPDVDLAAGSMNSYDTFVGGQRLYCSVSSSNPLGALINTPWVDRLYLSNNYSISADDWLLSERENDDLLCPDSSPYTYFECQIPCVAPGDYYLIAVIDADNDIEEINEANNTAIRRVKVVAPDLRIESADAPTSAAQNDYAQISYVVHGVSTGVYLSWQDKIYLSADAHFDAADTLLETSWSDGNFPLPDEIAYGGCSFCVPAGTPPGDWYLLLVLDSENRVCEPDESNNVWAAPFHVRAGNLPDLVPIAFSASTTNLYSGCDLDISYCIQNQGTLPASYMYDRILLSKTTGDTPEEITLWSYGHDLLDPGTSYTLQAHIDLPQIEAGDYDLILRADGYHYIPEINERNNEATIKVHVTRCEFQTEGQLGGAFTTVAVEGHYSYIGEGPNLSIWDVSNPSNPTRVGKVRLPNAVQELEISGGRAFVADGSGGLQIVDVSNPASPVLLGAYTGQEENSYVSVNRVAISGNFAYIVDNGCLKILDVSQPALPVMQGYYSQASLSDVAVSGGYAIATAYYGDLQIIDIKNPNSPTLVGRVSTQGYNYKVTASNDRAYIGCGIQGRYFFQIYDISNAASPSPLGAVSSPIEYSGHAVISGENAFMACGNNGLQIVNVSNPSSPAIRGAYDTPGYACDVAVSNGKAFIADKQNGLLIIDVSTPASPALLSNYKTSGLVAAGHIAVSEGLAAVMSYDNGWGLATVDVSAPASPVLLGKYGFEYGAEYGKVALSDGLAYIVSQKRGLEIVDVSNPTTPVLRGTWPQLGEPLPDYPTFIAVSGGQAFLAIRSNGLRIIDVSHPESPELKSSVAWPGQAEDAKVVGNMVFIAAGEGGVLIVDIADPASPVIRGAFPTSGYAMSLTVEGGLAYVAAYDSGLQILDVSDPASPVLLGAVDTPGEAESVEVSNGYAWIAEYGNELQIVDVRNPASPVLLGAVGGSYGAQEIAISGGFAYLPNVLEGLQVVDISHPRPLSLLGAAPTVLGTDSVMKISGNMAYAADYYRGLKIVDVSNPAAPVPAGEFAAATAGVDLDISGNLAFLAAGYNGLQVIDVENPASPALQSTYNAHGYVRAVAVSGNLAFIAEDYGTLQIVDISNPKTPVLAGSLDIYSRAQDIAISGQYAYLAVVFELIIVDAANPSSPVLRGKIDMPGYTTGVAVSGDRAFVASEGNLLAVDVSNPASPVMQGSCTTGQAIRDVAISGTTAYFTGYYGGLGAVNISNPASPILHAYSSASANAVEASGGLIYTLNSLGELMIQSYGCFSQPPTPPPTPSPSPSISPTRSATPPVPSPSASSTPETPPTASHTPTHTSTSTATPTSSPSPSPTVTAAPTATPSEQERVRMMILGESPAGASAPDRNHDNVLDVADLLAR